MDRTSKIVQNFVRIAKNINLMAPLSLIPLFLLIGWAYNKQSLIKALEREVAVLEKKATAVKAYEEREERVWRVTNKSSPLYLCALESLSLLTPEKHRIEALCRQYPDNTVLRERLNFLQGESNRIKFRPSQEREAPSFHETEFALQNRVQMNEDDLKAFLAALEESEERPLIIIKEFHLKKEREKGDEWIYNIDAEIIKRSA